MTERTRQKGHVLIVIMVFLMLSSQLLLSALEIYKQDSLSTIDFERAVLRHSLNPLSSGSLLSETPAL